MVMSWLFMRGCFATPHRLACMEFRHVHKADDGSACVNFAMKKPKPTSRTEASAPDATKHLREGQKQALDDQAEAEHTDGPEREKLTEKMKKAAG